jgi:DNA helicase II / ATP-dependent DNA helicase PcrA
VLVRSHREGIAIRDALTHFGVPAVSAGRGSLYETDEAAQLLALLLALSAPGDDRRLRAVLATPLFGFDAARLQALDDDGDARRRWQQDLADWRLRWETHGPQPMLADVVAREAARMLAFADGERRITHLLQLGEQLQEARARRLGPQGQLDWLRAAIAHADREDEAQWPNLESDASRVQILTLHKSKGLEFPLVFLPGWEEGVFPSQRSLDEGGLASLEEERRLGYVAITRARRSATILHAANRRIYGQWTSSIPSRFVAELPKDHIEEETTMTGGESLWRAQWSERGDPFAHVARPSRGPGWQRASTGGFNPQPQRIVEARASAVSLGNKGRDDLSVGQRVFHGKFGYGTIEAIEGNKLEIEFEKAGRKRVLDSFVSIS